MDGLAVAEAVAVVRQRVAGLRLALSTERAARARADRDALVAQIDDYVLPRLRDADAPLLVVVSGSTGAGKSTLVNSLLGTTVSPPGVRRPTTRAPVLVCNPDEVGWFSGDRILPGMPRRTGGGGHGEPGELSLVPSPAVPPGFALLDAPDIDSVVEANRALATQLLAAADLWLFVTTAARYADAVPWSFLRTARERATAVAVVLDRVPPEAAEVREHLVEMLRAEELGGTPVLTVPETTLDDGRLPPAALAQVRGWLDELAADAQARASVVRRTLTGALDSLEHRLAGLADAVDEQDRAVVELAAAVTASYAAARTEVDDALASGALLRGEVLARWQEFVGGGELMRSLQAGVGQVRDKVWSFVTGRPSAERRVQEAVESSIASLLRAAAEQAADGTVAAWSREPAGRELTAAGPPLDGVSASFGERAAREIRDWEGAVVDLVREQGSGRKATARVASYTVNGAGLAVMLAVFAHTGGLTGAEFGVAAGTSALGQRILEAILGDQAVRDLADRARRDLLDRARALLDTEAVRFTDRVRAATEEPGAADRVRAAVRSLREARR